MADLIPKIPKQSRRRVAVEPAPERPPLPIDDKTAMGIQSVNALMVADDLGIITYRYPLDMTNPSHIQRVLDEYGAGNIVLPEEKQGMYYVFEVKSDAGEKIAMIFEEGTPRAVAVALAARKSLATARRLQYADHLLPREK